MPLRGVAAMVSQRWCCGSYESRRYRCGPILLLCRVLRQCSGGLTNLRQAHSLSAYKKQMRPSTEYCWSCHRRNIKTLAISECWAPSRVRQKAGVWQSSRASVMLRRAHRCRAERLAGGGPRRPPGRRAPFLAFARNRGRRAAPTHRLVYAIVTHPVVRLGALKHNPSAARGVNRRDPERSGGRLLTPAGTSFYVRRAGGHLLDGCPAERPSGCPEPRAQDAAVGEAARERRERQGPAP
jgi:hypothetical protein